MRRPHRLALLLSALLTTALGLFGVAAPAAQAASFTDPPTSVAVTASTQDISECALADLPPEASETLDLIHTNGPFPYPDKDGTVFQNREGLLPDHPEGYYREYTVPTPGSDDRGARRLVGGGDEPTQPDDVYYTGDHYESFCHISDA